MPLELAFMDEGDARAFATIDGLAMADWPVGRAMVLAMASSGERRQTVIERWFLQGFRNNSELAWLKIIDTDLNGEIIACALWRFNLTGDVPKIGAPAPVQEVTDGADTKGAKPEAGTKATIWSALEKYWSAFRDEFIGSKPHADLQICITHPKHQRRGAGSMLVKWGCDKADERGLMCVLQASEAGLKLYQNFGFRIVKESALDVGPYGIDETEIRRGMVRPSKTESAQ